MRMRCRPVAVVLLMLFAGCGQEAPVRLPTISMPIGLKTYTLEIADEPLERETGLMRRDDMPADRGMIFIFPEEEPVRFHMLNTRIPLDILFINSAGEIVASGQMEPYSGKAESGGPAKYVVELNAGQAAAAGVVVKQTVSIPTEIKTLSTVR